MDISEQPGFSNLKYKSLRICGGITFVAFVFIHIVLADCDLLCPCMCMIWSFIFFHGLEPWFWWRECLSIEASIFRTFIYTKSAYVMWRLLSCLSPPLIFSEVFLFDIIFIFRGHKTMTYVLIYSYWSM